MKFYKNTDGTVFGFEADGSQDELITADMSAMTQDDVDAHLNPPPTREHLLTLFTNAIQARLDTFARTRNYDSILSACTYATSGSPKSASEGQACVNLRDATWSAAYTILAAVEAGSRAMPASIGDIASELPAMVWPV